MLHEVAIVGGGLSGLMAALLLGQQGYKVSVYEKRRHADLSQSVLVGKKGGGRSMSMDLSDRGIYALQRVNLLGSLKRQAVLMRNKIFHKANGSLLAIPYGRNEDESILTVSRAYLYETLYEATKQFNNIEVKFGHELVDMDFNKHSLEFESNGTRTKKVYERVIGADGINSKVRDFCFLKVGKDLNREPFSHCYKELSIPQEYANMLELEAMHLWPRPGFMLVAQPNYDQSFTCALLMQETKFQEIGVAEGNIEGFFRKNFSDVYQLMPNLRVEYDLNPIGTLNMIKADEWTFNDWVLVIGDAIHGMTPFFGQGVNCCFENCTTLVDLLAQNGHDWKKTLQVFDQKRPKEARAINRMSRDNYPELKDSADVEKILFERQLESLLSREYKEDYRSYHNLVCFDRISYRKAEEIRTLQIQLLSGMSEQARCLDSIDSGILLKTLENYKKALAKIRGQDESRTGA